MSRHLRDSAERNFLKASKLMQNGKNKEALVELQKAEEAAQKSNAHDILLRVLSTKGHLMQILGKHKEALKIHSLTLKFTENILSEDPDNEFYQSIFQMNFNSIDTLRNLFYDMGCFLQVKNCYELHLSIYQNLLQKDLKTSLINYT